MPADDHALCIERLVLHVQADVEHHYGKGRLYEFEETREGGVEGSRARWRRMVRRTRGTTEWERRAERGGEGNQER